MTKQNVVRRKAVTAYLWSKLFAVYISVIYKLNKNIFYRLSVFHSLEWEAETSISVETMHCINSGTNEGVW